MSGSQKTCSKSCGRIDIDTIVRGLLKPWRDRRLCKVGSKRNWSLLVFAASVDVVIHWLSTFFISSMAFDQRGALKICRLQSSAMPVEEQWIDDQCESEWRAEPRESIRGRGGQWQDESDEDGVDREDIESVESKTTLRTWSYPIVVRLKIAVTIEAPGTQAQC